ncbi:unnamed protein product [Lasius platythorax]|uniref:Uncharacterized protein n=1 Tax=Lasius platythorax TaxID=488582 RepID=A0AAV2NL72_9HYME
MGLQFYEAGLWQQLRLRHAGKHSGRERRLVNVSSVRYAFQVVAAHCTIVKTIKKRKRQWHYNSAELNSSNVKTQSLAFSADLYLRLHGPPTLAGGADYSSRRTSCSRKFRHHVTTESDRTESFRPETPADDSPS